jgi:hypothetical protein
MQNSRRIDEIERASDRSQFVDIGLSKLDIGHAPGLRHALGIAEARETEIYGKNADMTCLARKFDRAKSGAAAGDQDVGRLSRCRTRGGTPRITR